MASTIDPQSTYAECRAAARMLDTDNLIALYKHAGSDAARQAITDEITTRDTVCAWFAGCSNSATHLEPHPVLGAVPACDRCSNIGR